MKKEVVGEGTHFMIPWVQRPIIYDIRARCYCSTYSAPGKAHIRVYRPKNVPAITGSKDLQNVNITLRILFRCVQFVICRLYRLSDNINRTFLEI